MTTAAIALAFVDAINRRSPEEIAALMTEDHGFIDSLGNRVAGRDRMRHGWRGYFSMVPDYTITVTETLADGPVVVMLGSAQGTYSSDGTLKPENRWQTPAAWRALVRESSIAEWRVYADNEPVRRIMASTRPGPSSTAEPPTSRDPAAP
jgi:uncharacterized protein (TIGR02246 family)